MSARTNTYTTLLSGGDNRNRLFCSEVTAARVH